VIGYFFTFFNCLLLFIDRIIDFPNILTDTIEEFLVDLNTILLALLNVVDVVCPVLEFIIHCANYYPIDSFNTQCGMNYNQIHEIQDYVTRQSPHHISEVIVL
jgi:hypothetical protein